jgi:hypothetical protein
LANSLKKLVFWKIFNMTDEKVKAGISFETGFNTFFFLTYLLCTAFSFVVNGFSLKSFFISPFVGLFLFILVYPGFLVFFLAGAVLFHILLLFKDLFRNSS